MGTIAEAILKEEIAMLVEVVELEDWRFGIKDNTCFRLGLPARDSSWFWLLCNHSEYPVLPPAWHWMNIETDEVDALKDTPKGASFFHSSGIICAPWNRLAYKEVNSKGPHGDWQLASWKSNPKTGECKTLAAMALRISVELKTASYSGRMAA